MGLSSIGAAFSFPNSLFAQKDKDEAEGPKLQGTGHGAAGHCRHCAGDGSHGLTPYGNKPIQYETGPIDFGEGLPMAAPHGMPMFAQPDPAAELLLSGDAVAEEAMAALQSQTPSITGLGEQLTDVVAEAFQTAKRLDASEASEEAAAAAFDAFESDLEGLFQQIGFDASTSEDFTDRVLSSVQEAAEADGGTVELSLSKMLASTKQIAKYDGYSYQQVDTPDGSWYSETKTHARQHLTLMQMREVDIAIDLDAGTLDVNVASTNAVDVRTHAVSHTKSAASLPAPEVVETPPAIEAETPDIGAGRRGALSQFLRGFMGDSAFGQDLLSVLDAGTSDEQPAVDVDSVAAETEEPADADLSGETIEVAMPSLMDVLDDVEDDESAGDEDAWIAPVDAVGSDDDDEETDAADVDAESFAIDQPELQTDEAPATEETAVEEFLETAEEQGGRFEGLFGSLFQLANVRLDARENGAGILRFSLNAMFTVGLIQTQSDGSQSLLFEDTEGELVASVPETLDMEA